MFFDFSIRDVRFNISALNGIIRDFNDGFRDGAEFIGALVNICMNGALNERERI